MILFPKQMSPLIFNWPMRSWLHTQIAARVCGALAEKLRGIDAERVISPALGGIIVGHEVARALGKPHIFVEKEEGKLVLRRGFEIRPGARFIVAEDVVTRGGRVQETIDTCARTARRSRPSPRSWIAVAGSWPISAAHSSRSSRWMWRPTSRTSSRPISPARPR